MRKWLFTLALVPALAWGQEMTRQQCLAPAVRESMMRTALNMQDAKERGVTERTLLEYAFDREDDAFRASIIAAISEVYSRRNPPISSVADAMQVACAEAARR